jgi:hypothetical protein
MMEIGFETKFLDSKLTLFSDTVISKIYSMG